MMLMSALRRPTAVLRGLSVVAAAVLIAGCGSTPKEPESKWSAERLYAEAKEEASMGNYERAGKLYERDQQAARDSYQSFRQLVDQFPQSLYADDARVRMNYIISALAAYELHVARYYYRRGAYVAAANRAQVVISEFQQSPSAEEA